MRAGLFGKTTLENNHFQYAVRPGATVNDSFDLLNLTAEEHTFRVYGADLTQGVNGGLAPTFPEDKQRDAGAWIHLDQSSVTLGRNGTKHIGMTVNVPEDVPPGDHLGAVVASSKARPTGGGVAIESRVALMVRVRIPGVAKLDGFVGQLHVRRGDGGRKFWVEVHNTGNLLVTTVGRIDVKSGSSTVAVLPVNPKEIYIIPFGKAKYEATWTGTPLFGKRRAQAVFTLKAFREPDITRSSKTVTMSFFSWLFVILLLLLILAIVAAVWRNRRRADVNGEEPPPPAAVVTQRTKTLSADSSADDDADSNEWYS